FVACSGNQPKPVTDEKDADTNQVKPASKSTQPGGQQAPVAGGGGAPAVEKPAELVELEKAYESNPKDDATKKKLVKATYDFGYKVEYDNGLPPFVKYRTALKQFRRVLELDPSHEQAAVEKKQIEDIYKQMGRPIPE